jgi:polar amino acid transport system substrate-binding protein
MRITERHPPAFFHGAVLRSGRLASAVAARCHTLLLALMLAVSLLTGSISPTAHAVKLALVTENTPPTNMIENGKMIGPNTDKVRELMLRAKVDFTLTTLPWKRAYLMATQTVDTCIYPATRTAEREALFHWIGPVNTVEWLLYAAADRPLRLENIEQARPYLIGTYLGDARDEFFRSRGFQVESVVDDLLNPKKLLVHRIDLWAASRTKGKLLLQQNGWSEKIVPVLSFNTVDLYLACNINTAPELAKRLNGLFGEIKADGTFKAIEKQYAY